MVTYCLTIIVIRPLANLVTKALKRENPRCLGAAGLTNRINEVYFGTNAVS